MSETKHQYAPYGIGYTGNNFWLHVGGYSVAFATLASAKSFARTAYPRSGTYIKNREGAKVWKRDYAGKETEL